MATSVTTNVTELPESRVRVEATVAPDEVARRIDQAARELGRQLKIDGFRKGKVPASVVIRRLGREYVLDEAMRKALGNWYVDAIDAAGIVPVGEPDLDVGDLPPEGEPLSFSIEIGVRPKAKLGEYKGIEVGRREPVADEATIDTEIERMRDRLATLETVERPAQTGDHVVMDYLGTIDGEPFDGGEGRDQLLELGSGRLIPGFEEQLVGASAGDERTVNVTFPTEYVEHLAGKEAQFAVKVSEVKAKQLPELDDEFASEAGGFDTLQELRDDIAERIKEIEGHNIEHEFERAVIDAVAAGAEVEVPHPLIHARAHEMLEDTFASLARQGITKDAYLRIANKSEEDLAHEAEDEAEQSLKRDAVIAAVVEAEGIAPTEAELLEALAASADRAKSKPEKLLKTLRDSGRIGRMEAEVAARQAVELLVKEAKPIPVEQAEAREKIWTPDKEKSESGELWTPGS